MPPTLDVEPAAGPEIKMSDLGKGKAAQMPPEILAAARAAAEAGGGTMSVQDAPEPLAAPESRPPVKDLSVPKREINPAVPAKTEPKPEAKPAVTPKPGKDENIAALRESAESMRSRIGELEVSDSTKQKLLAENQALLDSLKSKVTTYETEIEKSYKPQVQKLAEMEKRLAEREEQLRVKDFTSSQEWHEKYVRPVAEAVTEAESLMSELLVTDSDGNQREATKQDFEAVLAQRTTTQAAEKAEELFGPRMFQTVVNLRARVITAKRAQQAAFERGAIESAEHAKFQQQSLAQQQQRMKDMLLSESKKLVESDDVFKVEEGDTEAHQALSDGWKLADASMTGDPSMTPEQFIGVVAKARTNIAKANVLNVSNSRLRKENEALKTELAAYRKSEPEVRGTSRVAEINGKPAPGSSAEAKAQMLAAAVAMANSPGRQ